MKTNFIRESGVYLLRDFGAEVEEPKSSVVGRNGGFGRWKFDVSANAAVGGESNYNPSSSGPSLRSNLILARFVNLLPLVDEHEYTPATSLCHFVCLPGLEDTRWRGWSLFFCRISVPFDVL